LWSSKVSVSCFAKQDTQHGMLTMNLALSASC